MKKYVHMFLLLILLTPFSIYAKEGVTFSKCIDGDTVEVFLHNEKVKVRLLAVDTPESKHPDKGEEPFGKEASIYTCQMVKEAKVLQIEYDLNSDRKDKYNRSLAWLWIDGTLLQESLIQEGLASVAYLYGDYKYVNLLQEKESIAKQKQLGIWSNYIETKPDLTWTGIGIIVCIFLFFTSPIYRSKVRKVIKKEYKKKWRR